NTNGHAIVDHYTYGTCGDSDLMEGVSQEAASLAGHLKLGKLIDLYDSTDISLLGALDQEYTESDDDSAKAYGWHISGVKDSKDNQTIEKALLKEKENKDQPTLIEVKTVIGYGSPNKGGKSDAHGAPLGKEERELVRQYYQWDHDEFHVPEEVKKHFEEQVQLRGEKLEQEWQERFEAFKEAEPELAKQFELAINGELPENWNTDLPIYDYTKSL